MEKSSYVLGSELWESKFDGLLSLVKEYNIIIDVWEIRKHKLYDSDLGLGLCTLFGNFFGNNRCTYKKE